MPIKFPHTPGIELAGVVEEVGPGVTDWKKGQAVYAGSSGAHAEYAVVHANALVAKPASLSFEQAASVPVGAVTAWRAMELADVKAGQHVLVQGAAGGVGIFAVQLSRWKGAHIIGTASANNHEFLRSLGVETVVDYHTTPIESAVRDVDVALDTVGGEVGVHSVRVLRPGGVYVTVAGQPPKEEAQKLGVKAEGIGPSDAASNGEYLRQITDLVESGEIKVPVTNVFPLAEARKAFALGETGHGRGRIVLRIAD
jgi:NADPH:quinone reductase-like Zn-dependent oxidoreductase